MSKRKVKVGLCYGEIINAAEDEGWEDTWPDADSEEEYLPEHCDASEADALEYLFDKKDIEVVFVDPHTWEPMTAKQVEDEGYCGWPGYQHDYPPHEFEPAVWAWDYDPKTGQRFRRLIGEVPET